MYRSFIIRRTDDSRQVLHEFRRAVAALNAYGGNTGMNLFRAVIAPIADGAPFFRATVVTGSHEASVIAVAEGRADLASIDCVSLALLERGRPELIKRVAIVAKSPLSPCLPFIAAARLPAPTIAAVREALFGALTDPDLAEARAALGLKGARVATPTHYDQVIALERDAAAMVTRNLRDQDSSWRLHRSNLSPPRRRESMTLLAAGNLKGPRLESGRPLPRA